MIFSVLVETRQREGLADPQGHTIERSLPALGFEGITGMRVGKAFRFQLEAPDDEAAYVHADEVTQRFLINPVIEAADITVSAAQHA